MKNNHDNLIIKLFFTKNERLSKNYMKFIKRYKKNKYINIANYIKFRFTDLTDYNSQNLFRESLYRILNHIDIRPKCKVCGNYTKFNHTRKLCYNDHCSVSCEMKNKNIRKQMQNTCLKKYGTINNIQKAKKTNLQKYGIDNPAKLKIIKEKIKKTNLEKYGFISPLQNKLIKEKTKKTNLEKYGSEYAQQNKYIKEKIKKSNEKTCLEKYGVNNVLKLSTIQKNIYESKRKNNSFHISKTELISYHLLSKKYPDIQYQYKSKLYPFICDFYIPSLDLYIECNYHWTHGGKLYEGTKEDNIKLEKWKSKNTKYYNNAINCWTIRDPLKRKIAKENNLNYLEFWNINELKIWLNENE